MFADRAQAILSKYAEQVRQPDPSYALADFLRHEGFTNLMMREMRNPFEPGFAEALEYYDGPPALREQWLRRRDALHDIGMRRCRRSGTPVRWSELRTAARGPALRIFRDLEEIGWTEGVSMAHVPLDRPAVFVSIAGKVAATLSDDDLLSLYVVVTHFVTLWLERNPAPANDVEQLSPREVEILAASSAGLTGRQLGETIGLSPHTVQSYLKSIRMKLGARSMPHAVQIGLARGLIAA